MKVITIQQPWASLIIMDAKHIETRSWNTQYRGPLLIHAAAGLPRFNREICYSDPFKKYITHWSHIPLGMIIGQVELVDTNTTEFLTGGFGAAPIALTDQELKFGDYSPDRFGWHLQQVKAFATPIRARGQLGLWNFPDDQLAAFNEKQEKSPGV